MTAALLDRPAIAGARNCRYAAWCNGSDHNSTPRGVLEHNHWSDAKTVDAITEDDCIAVQLYGYENAIDGVDPVLVYLALADGYWGLDLDGFSMTPDAARALGVALQRFQPKYPHNEELVFAHDVDGVRLLSVEYRHDRLFRDRIEIPPVLEFSVQTNPAYSASRVQLEQADARRAGRLLVDAADQADASNLDRGLTR